MNQLSRIIPNSFLRYKEMELTPKRVNFLNKKHNTKVGSWGQINLTNGEARFEILDSNENVLSSEIVNTNKKLVVPPATWHRLVPISQTITGSIHFYCHPDFYFNKKYQLTKPHSDVVKLNQLYLTNIFNEKKSIHVLDMGSGRGRNSLYLLQQGCHVFAVDINAERINILNDILNKENIKQVTTVCNDLNKLQLSHEYDVILLNVVLQFIDKKESLNIIQKAKCHTTLGGLHSIVCPVETPGIIWPDNFKCILQPEELKNIYLKNGWSILEYNEDFGNLHILDETGLPKRGRFASIICQKIL